MTLMLPSLGSSASSLESLSIEQLRELLRAIKRLPAETLVPLLYDWTFWARPNQLPPEGQWTIWLMLAGRGFGKTRGGGEWVRARVESGHFGRIGLIGKTAADVRDIMIQGESGIIEISPPWMKPKFIPSQRKLLWPNGAFATLYSAKEPDQLRGPQHDTVWADEPCKWQYLDETWDNMEMGLRIGPNPQVCASTTPRAVPWLKRLLADPQCVISRGSTYENMFNLPPAFIKRVVRRYEGTRLGQQELHAEVFEDDPNALWKRDIIEQGRIGRKELPALFLIAVGVDPQASTVDETSETGIVAAGLDIRGHAYVLSDGSLHGKPEQWGKAVQTSFDAWKGDVVVGEVNQGGDMVAHVMMTVDASIPFHAVHATRGKRTRAEPIAMLYEQGWIHHLGILPELEDEMCTWVPGERSPNRMDALVWVLHWLYFGRKQQQEGYVMYEDRVEISPI